MLSIYLSKHLEEIVSEYLDSKAYLLFSEIDPNLYTVKKLKNNLVQDLPVSYLEKVNWSYREAVRFINLKYKDRKINPEVVTNIILKQMDTGGLCVYDNVLEIIWYGSFKLQIDNILLSRMNQLEGLLKIWYLISKDSELNSLVDKNLFTNLFNNNGIEKYAHLLRIAWSKFIQETEDVYETSDPNSYEDQLFPYLKKEMSNSLK